MSTTGYIWPQKRIYWLFFLLILLVSLFANINLVPLALEEPRRALVALEMDLTGDYLVPQLNGYLYYNKPPVFNWLILILYKVFNSYDELLVRLPTILSFIAVAIINYKVVKNKVNQRVAVFSSLFFLTSAKLLFYFSFQGEIDLFYSLIVFLQILCILHYFEKGNDRLLFLLSYILAAVGVLTKGIPSIAFQALTILTIFIYHKAYKRLFSVWNFAGLSSFILIVGGYFYLYSNQAEPIKMLTILFFESSKRTALEDSLISSLKHLYEFPLMFLTISLPWPFILFFTRWQEALRSIWNHPWLKNTLLFFVSNIVIYWLSPGVRDRYLYMFIPFFCTFLAYIVSDIKLVRFRLTSIILLVLLIILLVSAVVVPFVVPSFVMQQTIIVAIPLFIALAALLLLSLRYADYRLYLFILAIIVVRLGFDFIVFPIRENEAPPYRELTKEIAAKANGQQIFLYAEKDTVWHQNPLVKEEVPVDIIEWPPYKFSYYLSAQQKSIVQHKTEPLPGELYIAKKSSLPLWNFTPIMEFNIEMRKKDVPYVLFQVTKHTVNE